MDETKTHEVTLPAGVVENIFGSAFGPGTYTVTARDAAELRRRGYELRPLDEAYIEHAGQTVDPASGHAVTDTPPTPTPDLPMASKAQLEGHTLTLQYHQLPDPNVKGKSGHATLSIPLEPSQKTSVPPNSPETGTQTTPIKTGDLPDTFPHVEKLRNAEIRDFNALRSVVDFKEVGLSESEAADVSKALVA